MKLVLLRDYFVIRQVLYFWPYQETAQPSEVWEGLRRWVFVGWELVQTSEVIVVRSRVLEAEPRYPAEQRGNASRPEYRFNSSTSATRARWLLTKVFLHNQIHSIATLL